MQAKYIILEDSNITIEFHQDLSHSSIADNRRVIEAGYCTLSPCGKNSYRNCPELVKKINQKIDRPL